MNDLGGRPRRRPAAGPRWGRRARPRPLGAPVRGGADTVPCLEHDPDLWFADRPAELDRAKALCGPCPIRSACLAGAVDRREPFGVWGGQIFDGGQILTHKRPPGRPRKDSITPERYPAWSRSA